MTPITPNGLGITGCKQSGEEIDLLKNATGTINLKEPIFITAMISKAVGCFAIFGIIGAVTAKKTDFKNAKH